MITGKQWSALHTHLFPGDHDEHGAILRCGIARTARGTRLLVRDVELAQDGVDYLEGVRGYRRLAPEFVSRNIDVCAEEGLAYIAVHCHGGNDQVGFSDTDFASHERGYPALLDINDGVPVGALVFAQEAVAGDIWTTSGRHTISQLRVVGRPMRTLRPRPLGPGVFDPRYDRQTRIFGDRGQDLLRGARVAIIGLGGAGSLVCEYLTHLGVGELLLIDPDQIESTNVPRVVGARPRDARSWMGPLAKRFAVSKVNVASRSARRTNPSVQVRALRSDVMDPAVAKKLLDCDHIFLAADSALARRLVNSVTHQYLIPHTQVGAKVTPDADGRIVDIFSVSRYSSPGSGCLNCAGLIPASRLQEEATAPAQRARQRYVDDAEVHAPSVITLNAVAASRAVDDWLFALSGLTDASTEEDHWVEYHPLTDEAIEISPDSSGCLQCGPARFALGDGVSIPARPSRVRPTV